MSDRPIERKTAVSIQDAAVYLKNIVFYSESAKCLAFRVFNEQMLKFSPYQNIFSYFDGASKSFC